MDLPLPILGSYFDWKDHTFVNGGNGIPIKVLDPNPQRWAIIFFNPGTHAMYAQPYSDLVPNRGIPVVVGGAPVILDFRQVGSLVHSAWFVQTPGIGDVQGILEVLYNPPRMS